MSRVHEEHRSTMRAENLCSRPAFNDHSTMIQTMISLEANRCGKDAQANKAELFRHGWGCTRHWNHGRTLTRRSARVSVPVQASRARCRVGRIRAHFARDRAGVTALVNSREVRKKSAAQVFVEPVNRALPSQVGRCFVVKQASGVASQLKTVNSVRIDIAFVRNVCRR